MIEVLAATLILMVGLLSVFTAMDAGRRLGNNVEMRQTAAAIAERELQRIQSLPWNAIALTAEPTINSGAATNTSDPTHYLSSGPCVGTGPVPSPCYQWDWNTSTAIEPLVICRNTDAWSAQECPADSTADPTPWSETVNHANTLVRLSGSIYRFVTWVNETECGAGAAVCGGGSDYKRVSVVVTVNPFDGSTVKPVTLSTAVTDPVGGYLNPFTQTGITCNDHGTAVPCVN